MFLTSADLPVRARTRGVAPARRMEYPVQSGMPPSPNTSREMWLRWFLNRPRPPTYERSLRWQYRNYAVPEWVEHGGIVPRGAGIEGLGDLGKLQILKKIAERRQERQEAKTTPPATTPVTAAAVTTAATTTAPPERTGILATIAERRQERKEDRPGILSIFRRNEPEPEPEPARRPIIQAIITKVKDKIATMTPEQKQAIITKGKDVIQNVVQAIKDNAAADTDTDTGTDITDVLEQLQQRQDEQQQYLEQQQAYYPYGYSQQASMPYYSSPYDAGYMAPSLPLPMFAAAPTAEPAAAAAKTQKASMGLLGWGLVIGAIVLLMQSGQAGELLGEPGQS